MELFYKIRDKLNDVFYSTKLSITRMSTKVKVLILVPISLALIIPLAYVYTFSLSKVPTQPVKVIAKKETAIDIIEKAKDMEKDGNPAKVFDFLVTKLNRFSGSYTYKEKLLLRTKIDQMVDTASEQSIYGLYKVKDVTKKYSIYEFTGTVVASNQDSMYGSTINVSETKESSKYQLEVSGLEGYHNGQQVTFYGVPIFTGVDTPIKVEAYQPLKKGGK